VNTDSRGNEEQSIDVEVQILTDIDELSRAAASEFIRQGHRAVKERGRFSVVLSGGSTPKSLYSLLANDFSLQKEVPWDQTHFFWGDERHVPPDHPESNYRMARETMLSKIAILSENVHRIRSENPNAQQAAEEYEETVRTFFLLEAGELPRFDFVLLGMGLDGHTASLFPRTEALREQRRLVVANWVETFHTHRITMTLPALNQAAFILFLVSGQEKAEALRQVLEEKGQETPLPSQLIRPTHGRLLWLVDRGAGGLLTGTCPVSPGLWPGSFKENANARQDRKKSGGA
jgi:6-phosphogluconolactonase